MAGRQKDDSLATATTLLIAILGALSNAAIPLFTVNIALTDDRDFVGGRLLALYQKGLKCVQRGEGDATCHAGSVCHAVSVMGSGTRYSLIIFLHR